MPFVDRERMESMVSKSEMWVARVYVRTIHNKVTIGLVRSR